MLGKGEQEPDEREYAQARRPRRVGLHWQLQVVEVLVISLRLHLPRNLLDCLEGGRTGTDQIEEWLGQYVE